MLSTKQNALREKGAYGPRSVVIYTLWNSIHDGTSLCAKFADRTRNFARNLKILPLSQSPLEEMKSIHHVIKSNKIGH